MAVFQMFSRRNRAEVSDVEILTYDDIPNPLRVQIIHIWRDAFGDPNGFQSHTQSTMQDIHKALAREFGVFRLGSEYEDDFSAIANYFLQVTETTRALDIIEFTFKTILLVCSQGQYIYNSVPTATAQEAIDELNVRFLQHSVGYEFVGGSIIRKDREVLHKDIVLPALVLLHEKAYAGANQEYLAAHEHYRRGKYKECLNECLKAFESTMKIICGMNKWKYDQNATAKALIETCFKNDLIPSFLQSEVSSLRSALEAGIPTMRNKLSGHGQGETPFEVPAYYASYLLHLTASTIVFLVQAQQSKR